MALDLLQTEIAKQDIFARTTAAMAKLNMLIPQLNDAASALTNLGTQYTPLFTSLAAATEQTTPGVTVYQTQATQIQAKITAMVTAIETASASLTASMAPIS